MTIRYSGQQLKSERTIPFPFSIWLNRPHPQASASPHLSPQQMPLAYSESAEDRTKSQMCIGRGKDEDRSLLIHFDSFLKKRQMTENPRSASEEGTTKIVLFLKDHE